MIFLKLKDGRIINLSHVESVKIIPTDSSISLRFVSGSSEVIPLTSLENLGIALETIAGAIGSRFGELIDLSPLQGTK